MLLWDVHLVIRHQVVQSRVHLVLKEGVRNTQVVVRVDSDRQLARNRIPRVLVHFPNGGVAESHLSHLIVGTCRPQDLDFLALAVSHYLTTHVSLVGFVENINSVVYDNVREIDLLIGSESHLLDAESLTSGQAGDTPHDFFNVGGLRSVVPGSLHLSVKFLDVFHGPGSIVGWDRARLTDRVDVPHVVHGRWRLAVECLNVGVNILSANQINSKVLTSADPRAQGGLCNEAGCKVHVRRSYLASGSGSWLYPFFAVA